MNAEHKTVLQISLKFLQDQLTPTDVQGLLDHLYTEDILSRSNIESVNSCETCNERVSRLVAILEKQGKFAYPSLIEGLQHLQKDEALVIKMRETEEKLKQAKSMIGEFVPSVYVYDQSCGIELGQLQDELRTSFDPCWKRFLTKSVIESTLQEIFPDNNVIDFADSDRMVRIRHCHNERRPSTNLFDRSISNSFKKLTREELVRVTVLSTVTDVFQSTMSADHIDTIITNLQVYEIITTAKWNDCYSKASVTEKIVVLLDLLKQDNASRYEDFLLILLGIPKMKSVYDYCKSSQKAADEALTQTLNFIQSNYKENPLNAIEFSLEMFRNSVRQKCDRKLRRFITKCMCANAIYMLFDAKEKDCCVDSDRSHLSLNSYNDSCLSDNVFLTDVHQEKTFLFPPRILLRSTSETDLRKQSNLYWSISEETKPMTTELEHPISVVEYIDDINDVPIVPPPLPPRPPISGQCKPPWSVYGTIRRREQCRSSVNEEAFAYVPTGQVTNATSQQNNRLATPPRITRRVGIKQHPPVKERNSPYVNLFNSDSKENKQKS